MSEEKNFYVVGIGASAGGLEALNDFFANMDSNTGMAFIVIQHLAPDHESHMVSLLAKQTEMNICQAEDEMELKANSIYLIPPNRNLTLFNDSLYLAPRESNKYNLNLPIDIFFESLAKNKKNKAIGVILSGTGSDGTRGIRTIKEKNGLVIVQNSKSAKFSAMPNNAEATGLVDYILPPEKMGDNLLDYINHSYNQKDDAKQLSSDANKISKVLAIIKQKLGVDFTYYKDNTIIRRLERRIAINRMEDIKEYIEFLKESSEEIETLYRELLIGVTKFFRDEVAFKIIEEEIIPKIIARKNRGDEIRVWVTACSTGEEIYSLAILFREYIEKEKLDLNVKIFGTDISEEAIRKAGIGRYTENIAGEISRERLQKYFIKQNGMYQVSKKIREMTIFSVHNLIEDPPFHKMDLVSCRNLLIYFEPVLQNKVLGLFHFSLVKGGFLFLGSSETIGDAENFFESYNSKWRIYRALASSENSVKNDLIDNMNFNKGVLSQKKNYNNFNNTQQTKRISNINNINQAVLKNCLPDTAIINKENQLVHVIGDLNDYLQLSVNRLSLDILEMANGDLSLVLGIAINKAKRNNEQVIYNKVKINDETGVNLSIVPLKDLNVKNDFLAIQFETVAIKEEDRKESMQNIVNINDEEKLKERIKDLERELAYNKENLQATIEELEASNEELQATNEELMASNEELQSTNEELESVNEELITVNAEHQNKIEELTRLTNDMDNLLRSTNIGTLFLDNQLKVRKFTPALKKNMNLIESDIGRPLNHISHKLEYNNLLNDVKEVLDTLVSKELEVKTEDDMWYLLKILPYRTESNNIKGIVITLVNVNELKSSNYELQKLTYAVEKSPNMIVITDIKGQIEYINNAFSKQTGYQKEDIIGERASLLKSGETTQKTYQKLWETITAGDSWQGEFYNQQKNGEFYWEDASIFPIKDETGKIINFIKIATVIDDKKELEIEINKLEEKNKRLESKLSGIKSGGEKNG